MFDTNGETGRSRRTGGVRQRRGAPTALERAEEKGRVVAQAVSPGAVVAEVARQYDLIPHQLSN